MMSSKATIFFPASADESNVNSKIMLPSGSSAVKVFSAVTASPFITSASPVSLTIRFPLTVYSLPGIKFL